MQIHLIQADEARQPKTLPVFPNPTGGRPDGDEPPLVLEFHSPVLPAADIAAGKMPRLDIAAYLKAILSAHGRSIYLNIDYAGGRALDVIPIATALVQHSWHVTARIVRASSSGAFLALSADWRTIVPNGTVLVHRAARFATQPEFEALMALPADEKTAINSSLQATDDVTASLLVSRLGVSELVARRWMTEARSWCAAEAIERGFVHSIEPEAS